jgi:hypothetical protein
VPSRRIIDLRLVMAHVAARDEPLAVGLDGEHRAEADQRAVVEEDADDVAAAADLAVEALGSISPARVSQRRAR